MLRPYWDSEEGMARSSETSAPPLHGRTAIVIGAGVAGLAATLALASRGAAVTLLERDPVDVGADADASFQKGERNGAPQVHHSHVFLGRLRNLLRQKYPTFLQALMAAGARELGGTDRPPMPLRGLQHEPGDDELVALGCRRTTFEWVLRQHVLALPDVQLHAGARVVGLLGTRARTPAIAGVRLQSAAGERPLYAHLVVDASGRRSEAPSWLAELGARPVRETSSPSGIVYYTRYYRLRPGAAEPEPGTAPLAGDLDWVKFAVFPADNRCFSVTLAVPLAEPRLKVLAEAAAFDTLVRSIDGLAPWLDPQLAEPIEVAGRAVQAMGGLVNRVRRFVDAEGPVARRFFALGDAVYCTNPLYGRGCTQAFLHAEMMAEAVSKHPGDLARAALQLEREARALLDPFFRASVVADRDAVRRAEGREPSHWANRLRARFFREAVTVALRHDPVVFRAFLRMMNMLETPEQAFSSPEVVLRCLWAMGRRSALDATYPLPSFPERATTIARCEAAVGSPRKRPQRHLAESTPAAPATH